MAPVVKLFSEEEQGKLTLALTKWEKVPLQLQNEVVNEFYALTKIQGYLQSGGIEYAKEVLTIAVGEKRALEIIERLLARLKPRPFESLDRANAEQVFTMIGGEHPQTCALIMVHMQPSKAAQVLAKWDLKKQVDIVQRIATMEKTSVEHIELIDQMIAKKVDMLGQVDTMALGGVDCVAKMLSACDRTTEKTILDGIEADNPELADAIRAKLFTFEDIVRLDNKTIQVILQHIDADDLALALKGTAKESAIFKAFINGLSSRRRTQLLDDLNMMPPQKRSEVDGAQTRIVAIIRELANPSEDGKEPKIVLTRP